MTSVTVTTDGWPMDEVFCQEDMCSVFQMTGLQVARMMTASPPHTSSQQRARTGPGRIKDQSFPAMVGGSSHQTRHSTHWLQISVSGYDGMVEPLARPGHQCPLYS